MNDRNKLTMHVAGRIYSGWKKIRVRHSIEQIAGTFQIELTERWPEQPKVWAIPAGEYCEIKIGEHTVIAGFVDTVSVDYDAKQHGITVSGRDRTGDLVDCSAPSQAFSGLTFKQIADRLCKPYGITVYDETTSTKKLTVSQKKIGKQGTPPGKLRASGAVPKAACQNGESVFRVLDRIARSEGVLLVSDGEGGLLITSAGRAQRPSVDLVYGDDGNILSARSEKSHANLFSEITVKGQASGQGVDGGGLESIFSSKATVSRTGGGGVSTGNSQITRYRPLIIVAESNANAARIRKRAEWEAGNREAKSMRYSVKVKGWYPSERDNDIWRINCLVRVTDPLCRVDGDMLIAGVSFSLDDSGGTVADLELTSPKAFEQLPDLPQPDGGGGDGASRLEKI